MNKLGFGMMRIPKAGDSYDWDTVNKMVDAFMAGGGNYFDTCYTYIDGNSDIAIQKCVSSRKERSTFRVAEKLPGYSCKSDEDLQRYLNLCGGQVRGAGTSKIVISGHKSLHGARHKIMCDRIEAGTFLLATAITGGEIQLTNCQAKNISSLIHKLCDNTCKVTIKNDIIYLKSGKVKKGFSFSTGPYPFFPTDLQAQATSLLTVSDGVSVITENVFEMRFKHVAELIKMGADVCVKGRTAIVRGVQRLNGATVTASDLRGGASLVLAGLNAEGQTIIEDIRHVKRGYLDFDKKLRSLGADIITSK
jgi:UDP-N-acetylglucosamine 1-carboxyvinyltransferase